MHFNILRNSQWKPPYTRPLVVKLQVIAASLITFFLNLFQGNCWISLKVFFHRSLNSYLSGKNTETWMKNSTYSISDTHFHCLQTQEQCNKSDVSRYWNTLYKTSSGNKLKLTKYVIIINYFQLVPYATIFIYFSNINVRHFCLKMLYRLFTVH